MSLCVLVGVSVCASVALGQEFSLGSDFPVSHCDDETLEKDSREDTMEYMDNLKEDLDTSITPLSEMNSQDVSDDTTEKAPARRRGRVGRPRKTTLFPMTQNVMQGPKKRMRWDNNMNKFIMYTYYCVTKLETDNKEYRKRLRDKFLEAYPEWTTITEQRLADQKRSIRQNRLLDIDTLREIKRNVKRELQEQGIVVEEVAEDSRDKSFYD